MFYTKLPLQPIGFSLLIEIASHYVALAGQELVKQTGLASNSQPPPSLYWVLWWQVCNPFLSQLYPSLSLLSTQWESSQRLCQPDSSPQEISTGVLLWPHNFFQMLVWVSDFGSHRFVEVLGLCGKQLLMETGNIPWILIRKIVINPTKLSSEEKLCSGWHGAMKTTSLLLTWKLGTSGTDQIHIKLVNHSYCSRNNIQILSVSIWELYLWCKSKGIHQKILLLANQCHFAYHLGWFAL